MTGQPYSVCCTLEAARELEELLEANLGAYVQLEQLFTPVLVEDPYTVVPDLSGPVGPGGFSVRGKGPMRFLRLEDKIGGVVVWYWIDEERRRVVVERIC